jgi:hypothetical protein
MKNDVLTDDTRWLYLVFFNVLWVFLPIYALFESFWSITSADEGARVGEKKTS